MSFIVVIPARYASSRLPAKPLVDIAGKPMIQHVWERASQSQAERVVIATDHELIAKAAKDFGAEVCMTRENHDSGTDRLQEVAEQLQLAESQVVVNVQGDEPLIPAAVINQVAGLMNEASTQMASLYELIQDAEQVFDPNAVKVVTDNNGRALYFSRAPMPWFRDGFAQSQALPEGVQYKRHVGVYAYRAGLLNQFVTWPMGSLESIEKLEQLRVLEQGIAIQMAKACETIPAGVDTQADLEKVRRILGA